MSSKAINFTSFTQEEIKHIMSIRHVIPHRPQLATSAGVPVYRFTNHQGGTNANERSHAINDMISTINRAMMVHGHLEDTTYFITSDDEDEVLFAIDDQGAWEPSRAQQATIPVTIFPTVQGKDLVRKEAEMRSEFVNAVHKVTDEVIDQVHASASGAYVVVESDTKCTDTITYTDIC